MPTTPEWNHSLNLADASIPAMRHVTINYIAEDPSSV